MFCATEKLLVPQNIIKHEWFNIDKHIAPGPNLGLGMPPTNRGPPIKPVQFYFSLMIDANETK